MPHPLQRDCPLKILLVEDHQDTGKLLQALLSGLGHAVVRATTMHEGLARLAGDRFDILISDIGLPDGSGWELLQSAPTGSVRLPIAISGYGPGADRIKSREIGFTHYLRKPFDPEELLAILHEFAHSHPGGSRQS